MNQSAPLSAVAGAASRRLPAGPLLSRVQSSLGPLYWEALSPAAVALASTACRRASSLLRPKKRTRTLPPAKVWFVAVR